MRIDGVDIHIDGEGDEVVVMIHGWPDTWRLWDAQVRALTLHRRCVRFTLPGFDIAGPRRAHSMRELIGFFEKVVEAVSPGRPDTMARWLRVPSDMKDSGSCMNYPYYIQWTGTHGSYRQLAAVNPSCPMLFVFGRRKPVLFHAPAWADRLAARPGSRVLAMDTRHWVMQEQPEAVNAAVLDWLGLR